MWSESTNHFISRHHLSRKMYNSLDIQHKTTLNLIFFFSVPLCPFVPKRLIIFFFFEKINWLSVSNELLRVSSFYSFFFVCSNKTYSVCSNWVTFLYYLKKKLFPHQLSCNFTIISIIRHDSNEDKLRQVRYREKYIKINSCLAHEQTFWTVLKFASKCRMNCRKKKWVELRRVVDTHKYSCIHVLRTSSLPDEYTTLDGYACVWECALERST